MGNKLINCFQVLDDILKLMIKGEPLPLDVLHIAGSRMCSKTFSVEDFINRALLVVEGFGALAVRDEVTMAEELFTEYSEMSCNDYGAIASSNKTKKTLTYKTNKLSVRGLKSNKKSTGIKKAGLAKYINAKYIVFHCEEAFEIDLKDKQDIKLSLRSNNKTQILEINTCNPASLKNEYIAYLDENFKFDESILKTTGYQWSGIMNIDKKTPDGIQTSREAFLYVNWRAVQEVISPYAIKEIRKTWTLDPNRAKTVDYGMPGDIEGTIFGNMINKIHPIQIMPFDAFRIGVDYGWGTSGNRSPTVAWFLGSSPMDQGFGLFERYFHDNKVEYIDTDHQIKRLLMWAWNVREKYIKEGLLRRSTIIEIRFDNAHIGVIASINRQIQDNSSFNDEWKQFIVLPCDTKNRITKISQIEAFKMCLASSLFWANQKSPSVNEGIKCLSLIVWEDEKEEKMEHKYSHDFDAIIYGIGAEDLLAVSDREPAYFLRRKKWLNS